MGLHSWLLNSGIPSECHDPVDIVGAVAGPLIGQALGGGGSGGGGQTAASIADLKKANTLNASQVTAAKDNLASAQATLKTWQDIYGPIQENLGEYYKNLSADKIATMGLQQQQTAFQSAQEEIRKEYAQKGLSNSGLEEATTSNAILDNASKRATIRTNAPQAVANAQQGFLSLGLGVEPAILGNVSNAANTVNAAYTAGVSANAQVGGINASAGADLAGIQAKNQNEIGGAIAGGLSNVDWSFLDF